MIGGKALSFGRRPSRAAIGLIFFVAAAIAIALLAFKAPITTFFRPGASIEAEFARNYQMVVDETKVKVSGLEVGVVDGVRYTDHRTAIVSMKVDRSALDGLGTAPSAEISPLTVLGGRYTVELQHGGGTGSFTGGFIPLNRTKLPVELDRVLEALPKPTRESVRDDVANLDATLRNGGADVRTLVSDLPSTMRPADATLRGLQGTRPGVDLSSLVSDVDSTARVLSIHDGQLADIVRNLQATTSVLAQQSRPLAQGIDTLPTTLSTTRDGLAGLDGTLTRLKQTAEDFQPAAAQLDPLLRRLNPVLVDAQPLLRDLRPLVDDARPAVRDLVPVAQQGTQILNDVRGPVIDRVKGPIADKLMNTWHGTGPYANSGGGMQADHKFYEEIGYMAANLDRASSTQDSQGSLLGFQVGVNLGSVQGLPFTLQNLMAQVESAVTGGRP